MAKKNDNVQAEQAKKVRTPGLQLKRPRFHPLKADSDKLRTYRVFYRLNCAFELMLFNLDRLEELGFRRKFLGLFRHRAEELRAKTNFELAETLLEREQELDPVWSAHAAGGNSGSNAILKMRGAKPSNQNEKHNLPISRGGLNSSFGARFFVARAFPRCFRHHARQTLSA